MGLSRVEFGTWRGRRTKTLPFHFRQFGSIFKILQYAWLWLLMSLWSHISSFCRKSPVQVFNNVTSPTSHCSTMCSGPSPPTWWLSPIHATSASGLFLRNDYPSLISLGNPHFCPSSPTQSPAFSAMLPGWIACISCPHSTFPTWISARTWI